MCRAMRAQAGGDFIIGLRMAADELIVGAFEGCDLAVTTWDILSGARPRGRNRHPRPFGRLRCGSRAVPGALTRAL